MKTNYFNQANNKILELSIVDKITDERPFIEINLRDYCQVKHGKKKIFVDKYILAFKSFFIEVNLRLFFMLKISRKKSESLVCSTIIKSQEITNNNFQATIVSAYQWNTESEEYEFYPLSYFEERELKKYIIDNIYIG